MQSLQGTRTHIPVYAGPQSEAERARKIGRDARAEQQRMDLIRAQQLRSQARRAARAAR